MHAALHRLRYCALLPMPFLLLAGDNSYELLRLLIAIGVLLLAARLFGEIVRRFGQPAVLGELLAGIALGPALLGRLAPEAGEFLFPKEGPAAASLEGIRFVGIVLFLMVAGMEVDLGTIWKRGRSATAVSLAGILTPFAIGAAASWISPGAFGYDGRTNLTLFVLFVATALSISALPVIARTLMDLYLYRTDFGMVVIAAAVFDDLVGWIVFAILLGVLANGSVGHEWIGVVAGTLTLTVAMLTLGRIGIHRILPWVQAHTAWPSGVLVLAFLVALAGAAAAQWIGVHAVFGAFLGGVALGNSSHLHERTRATITDFVKSFFAPLFFASIGLSVDFVGNFDLLVVLVVTVTAVLGKVFGCYAGARLVGMSSQESWAVGYALNARGMMEIVLGLTALKAGLIGERLFVALVVMAILTSVVAGPMIQRVLGRKRPRRFLAYLSSRTVAIPLLHRDRREVIEELSRSVARSARLDSASIAAAVWAREELASTAVGKGIAVPHARLEGLAEPVIALGLAPEGLDFQAPDLEPVRIVLLILTPKADTSAQLEILSDISKSLRDDEVRAKILEARSYTEVVAALRAAGVD